MIEGDQCRPITCRSTRWAFRPSRVIKDFRNYDTRTRHTSADFADAVRDIDLKESATVLAAFAWQAAARNGKIPRRANSRKVEVDLRGDISGGLIRRKQPTAEVRVATVSVSARGSYAGRR